MMLLALLLAGALAQASVSGTVTDSDGAVIVGATVILRIDAAPEQRTTTGPDGRFTFPTAGPGATVIVRAGGFAEVERRVNAADSGDLRIELRPAGIQELVTVTPTRTEQALGSTPASVHIVDGTDIDRSPAINVDDVLREVPTFSLFRRTSSLSAHPTAQGVSLRGIGPSGVSRTLVLIDNMPFNDPFGGWVYWTRVPLESVDRVEVVDGPSSSLWGNYAMGGVINIVSSRPVARTVEFQAQYGNLNSPKADLFASDRWGNVGLAVEASAYNTDGFFQVVENERGPIDTKAAVDFSNVNVKADYRPSGRLSVYARTGYFREERDNAKVALGFTNEPEVNDTKWSFVTGGVRTTLPDSSDLQVSLTGDFETFRSNFLAVPNTVTRTTARVSLDQRVPSKGFGGMAQWSRGFGSQHYISVGTDWRWVDGDSEEKPRATDGVTVTLNRISGGTQRSLGAFVQDVFTPADDLTVTASVRVDHWKNYDGHNYETSASTGLPTANNEEFPDRDDTAVSPRIAAIYRATERASVWGAASWGFRAPTLNELYRQFRVGAILTLANENLKPEHLTGGEIGVNLEPMRNMIVRATGFFNRIEDPVFNLTIGTNLQERNNLERTRVRGFQTDVDYRLADVWRVSGGYVFNDATVQESSLNPSLEGNRLAQVPTHRGSIQLSYADPRYVNVGIGFQFIGRQFDDDQNIRSVPGEPEPGLPGYMTADITASRAFGQTFQVFVGLQNIFDEEYIVQTNPTTSGTPFLVHGGFRVRWAGR
jgi:outer membrane receptor protein involved in Fe transport